MNRDQSNDKALLKLLLLGTGESGKSTLFKQMINLYGVGFDDEARVPYASIIFTNIIISMKTLIRQAEKFGFKIADSVTPSANYIMNEVKSDGDVDAEVARHITVLWSDEAIKKTYAARSKFQLTDSCRYFFAKVDEVAADNYIPSMDDVLQCRARTTGIVETEFTLDENVFKMVDVGGQRNERKKWIHCFEFVTAVIFVAAINEYDQVLYEDGKTNRIVEALDLFEEICNSRWFAETSIMLFLNKRDLFQEKLPIVPMGDYLNQEHTGLPDFEGGDDYTLAVEYMVNLFHSRNHFAKKKAVYAHITCATDRDNVDFTFNVTKDIIIKARLQECGLLE